MNMFCSSLRQHAKNVIYFEKKRMLFCQILLIILQKEFANLNVKIVIVNENFMKHKCLPCNKSYSNKIDEEFKNLFMNTFKFSNNDINHFLLLLLLRKGVYPYEFMDNWGKFNKTYCLKMKNFIVT